MALSVVGSLFKNSSLNINELEKFSEELENIIKEWKLHFDKNELISLELSNKEKEKKFFCFDLSFKVKLIEKINLIYNNSYEEILNDQLNNIKTINHCFSSDAHFVERNHKIKNFILIQTENDSDILDSKNIIKLILSAISNSIINTKCLYPILLQIKEKNLELSCGLFINFGLKIIYESTIFNIDENDLANIPLDYFLKIFKNKLSLSQESHIKCQLIRKYFVKNYYLDLNELNSKIEKAHFKNISYDLIVNKLFTQKTANHFSFKGNFSNYLSRENNQDCCLNIQINQIEQSPILHSIFYFSKILQKIENDFELIRNFQFLELDNNEKQKYLDFFFLRNEALNIFVDSYYNQFKSTCFDSIIYRLALFIFDTYLDKIDYNDENIDFKTYYKIKSCWQALVGQLRRYWEQCEPIPCVNKETFPDLSKTCLLMQKIQMLNCCIEEKKKREFINQEDNDEESEEFFDCDQDLSDYKTIEILPEGRLEEIKGLSLLHDKNIPLYKPLTQECPPYTEDQHNEHICAYLGLNQNNEFLAGKNLLLISDMEAFRAANPKCCFEDFIRWCSPKDIIIKEDINLSDQSSINFELSDRFKSFDCLWRKMWDQCKPVPISKQKRFFNYSMEAERILKYLETIKDKDLFKHLFSTLVMIGCEKYEVFIDEIKIYSDFEQYFYDRVKLIAENSMNLKFESTSYYLNELDRNIFEELAKIYFFKKNFKNLDEQQLNFIFTYLESEKFLKINDDDLGRILMRKLDEIIKDDSNNSDENLIRFQENELTFITEESRPEKYSLKCPQKLIFNFSLSNEKKIQAKMNSQFVEDFVYF